MKEVWYCIIMAVLLGTLSCKKKTTLQEEPETVTTETKAGLPANLTTVNAYLFSQGWIYYPSNGSNFTNYFRGFAMFADPGKKLLLGFNHYNASTTFTNRGNVDVGEVICNGFLLNIFISTPNVTYVTNFNTVYKFPLNAEWEVSGNRSFVPVAISRSLPVISSSFIFTGMSKSGYTFKPDTLLSGYDSLVVIIKGGSGKNLRKAKVAGPSDSLVFPSPELLDLDTNNPATFELYLFNYAHKTVKDKIYVLEQSKKYTKSFNFTP